MTTENNANKTNKQSVYSRISDREYFIPFGLYSKDKKAEHKASEVFVGREDKGTAI